MGIKNIEQLFKEKLGDFNEVPDEKVWKSIASSLDKKKKKRVLPIWWQIGGVAAVLAILLYAINPFGGKEIEEQIIVTETENIKTEDLKENAASKSEDVFEAADVLGTEKVAASESGEDPKPNPNVLANQGLTEENASSLNKNQSLHTTQNGQAVADNASKTNEDTLVPNKIVAEKEIKDQIQKESMTITEAQDVKNKTLDQEIQDTGAVGQNNSDIEAERALANNPPAEEVLEDKSPKTKLEQEAEKEAVAINGQEDNSSEKQSIFDAIAEQEEQAVAQGTDKKWSIGPSIAPVYFSASGEGSPVHSTFASNSKSGNVDLSYGLTVAYEIGKKIKIRSGVHRVNYGYDTNDVVFSSSLDGSANAIDNIDYSRASRNIVVESKNTPAALNVADQPEFLANQSAVLDGKMVQQLGYLEVPLEINYSLVDKKFGVDLIGGVSSLFLVDNSVLLESEGLVTEVGEANNANTVNFSTNVGVGLNYEFSPKVQFNLEPVFKYQLNTFSETAGSFRPFSVGVYSGVSFKF